MKLIYRLIALSSGLLITTSCQKDDNADNSKDVNICPEVSMGNYEEVGMIINDYLQKHAVSSISDNQELLVDYLERCSCVQSVELDSAGSLRNRALYELTVKFNINSEAVTKTLELQVINNGHLEFKKFRE